MAVNVKHLPGNQKEPSLALWGLNLLPERLADLGEELSPAKQNKATTNQV